MSAVSANENIGAESETDDQQEDDLIESLAQTDDEINASEAELDTLIDEESGGEDGNGKKPKPKSKTAKKELLFSDLEDDDAVVLKTNTVTQIIANAARLFKKNIALKL